MEISKAGLMLLKNSVPSPVNEGPWQSRRGGLAVRLGLTLPVERQNNRARQEGHRLCHDECMLDSTY